METCPCVPVHGSSVLAIGRNRGWDGLRWGWTVPPVRDWWGWGRLCWCSAWGQQWQPPAASPPLFGDHGEVWPFASPFISADACVLMRGQTPALSAVSLALRCVPSGLGGGDFVTSAGNGDSGAAQEVPVFWGDPAWLVGLSPTPVLLQDPGSRSHLEHGHLTNFPAKPILWTRRFSGGTCGSRCSPELSGGD